MFTVLHRVPVFSSEEAPSTQLHAQHVLVQHAQLVCTMDHPFCSLVSSLCKRWGCLVHSYALLQANQRPWASFWELQLLRLCGTLSDALEATSVSPSLDTKMPLSLTPWQLLTSHQYCPSPSKLSLKGYTLRQVENVQLQITETYPVDMQWQYIKGSKL